MNKRSFFCGVVVGVLLTWALSFYLYYSLNNSEISNKLANFQKNIFNDDSDEESDEKLSNSIDEKHDKFVDGKSSYFKQRLKKEKAQRKISRQLIDELQPVTIKQDPEFGLIRNVEDQFVRDNGYKTHAFNVLVSSQIGNFRDVPDTRHKM
jgi:polypeptide N-acetylgalactosaminyltransferase